MTDADLTLRDEVAGVMAGHFPQASQYGPDYCACSPLTGDWVRWTGAHAADALLPLLARVREEGEARLVAERDALAAAVDRVRRRHPRGDEESGYLAPGLWCPTCGRERRDNGYGGCDDRQALIVPGQPLRTALTATTGEGE